MKYCYNCIFCSELYNVPFADVCDIDNHTIDDVYSDVCKIFVDSEDDSITEDYNTLFERAQGVFKENEKNDKRRISRNA